MNDNLIVEPHTTEHATYSLSGMARTIACPISIPLSYGIIPPKPKQHTLDGTTAHELSELFAKAKLDNEPLPTKLSSKFTPEMIAASTDYTDAIYNAVKPYLHLKHMWWLETPVDIDRERDCWGTPDFLFIYKKKGELHAIIFDYKYGYMVVDSKDNWQLASYALGTVRSIFGKTTNIQDVTCYIYQPRVEFEAAPITYTYDELTYEIEPVISNVIDLIEDWKEQHGPDGEAYPQYLFDKYQHVGKHCQFCKAQPRCKAYANAHTKNIKDVLTQLIKQNGSAVKEYTDLNAGLEKGILSTDDMAFFVLHAPQIRNLLEAIPRVTMSLMAKGTEFKGIKVIETSKKRTWIADTKKLAKQLVKLGINTPVEKVDKWISISAVEKIVGKKNPKLAELTISPGVNYKIVKADHKNPAVKFGHDNLSLLTSILQGEREQDDED